MKQAIPGKELVFKIKADLLKSLAHPTRLLILDLLKNKELSVNAIAANLGIEQSGLSKHLSILRQSGILTSHQEKVTVYYSIRNKDIVIVLRMVSQILMKRFREGETILKHLSET